MEKNHLIYMVRGKESTLFILPGEVASELEFTDDDLLKFEVKNCLIIEKSDHEDERLIQE
jgi:hypothetical protein